MNKFKVGDRVRFINRNESFANGPEENMVGIVINIGSWIAVDFGREFPGSHDLDALIKKRTGRNFVECPNSDGALHCKSKKHNECQCQLIKAEEWKLVERERNGIQSR